MSKLFAKVKEEIIAVLPPTIFFFITLHLVAIVRVLMLKGSGIAFSTPLQVTVAALILGKAVLIADLLPFINLYPHKPLIYNVVWKTTIYVLVATLVHYLERLADSWKETGSLVAGNQKLLADIVWPPFLGHPDPAARIDSFLLHDARTRPRDRTGEGTGNLLRNAADRTGLTVTRRPEAQLPG
jgi:hypothetical protein